MMSDTNDVGSVQVKVSSKAVHNAVRNVITNELKVDAESLRAELRKDAEAQIEKLVGKYLSGNGYDEANFKSRVERAIAYYETKMEAMIRETIKNQVHAFIEREINATLEVVLKSSKFNVGWGRTATQVNLKMEDGK